MIAHRKQFLDEMKSLRESHLPPPPPSDERATTPPSDAKTRKRLVLIYHDESIFNTNKGQKWAWVTGEEPIIQPKTKGAEIMVWISLSNTMVFCNYLNFKHNMPAYLALHVSF